MSVNKIHRIKRENVPTTKISMNNFRTIYNIWMTTFYVYRHTTLQVARWPLTRSTNVRHGDTRVGEEQVWVEVDIFFFVGGNFFFSVTVGYYFLEQTTQNKLTKQISRADFFFFFKKKFFSAHPGVSFSTTNNAKKLT